MPNPRYRTLDSTRAKPAATTSIHGDFLEQAVPQWLVDATPQRKTALKEVAAVTPPWYRKASPVQRERVDASVKTAAAAQVRLDSVMSTFQDVETFAEPLLRKALQDQFQVDVDLNLTLLCLRRPLQVSVVNLEIGSFEFLNFSLLQAALHNFETWECRAGAYHASSGFMVETATPGTFEPVPVNLKVNEFLTLCRSLDVGAKYQAYLKAFFAADATLRPAFIASQKAAMRAAAEQALLTGDIEPQDHTMILSVIEGNANPRIGNKQVWFNDMGLMKQRLTGCVVFVIGEKHRYSDEVILYVPHDPAHPLKRYTAEQMRREFRRLFTDREGMSSEDATPTAYQQFFSQFIAYEQRPYYFSQFTQEAGDSSGGLFNSPWRTFVKVAGALNPLWRIKELPPERPANRRPEPDPYIAPAYLTHKGQGPWDDNLDLWAYLYEQSRDKVLADARSHAVPSADVDVKAREAKLAHLLEFGLLGLNLVSMFVPVLGEIMMTVMAGQLLYETFEGAIEWSEGDKRAAKAHLVDVAENLAQIAVMAGVGASVRRFKAARAEPLIESLDPVTLPNGQSRLWKPDLSPYESATSLDSSPGPNALGQHKVNGGTYVRVGGKVYEQVYDDKIKRWRIQHPSDATAYQPILHSNGQGAWRHTLERPLAWDRLTLLRRIGHAVEAFSDADLLKVADVSGVSDNALRKMHMDYAAPPPALTDAMRLFRADASAEKLIEQLNGARPIDPLYLYALPLVTEMPRWPAGYVLEVSNGAGVAGVSVRYGSERVPAGTRHPPTISVTRHDVLTGKLPERILAALDETQITSVLGEQPARVIDKRVGELGKQLADYARTRKPAIFDSLYAGTESVDARVTRLQRACPGLSEAAALEVLANARPDHLKQLQTSRHVPLSLLEEARWYARQGRQTRAYAGLRSQSMASADSRRLALHSLESLPGWPDTLRLEVRAGSIDGTLLDSVGSQAAPEKKFLVKHGPSFQAFNERGEALNSVPRAGDNFYASIMHALPDSARASLGVPEVSQNVQLQNKIIEFADRNRAQAIRALEPQGKWYKPPVRINDKRLGYYASGRGRGLSANLVARVRSVYPSMNDAHAGEMIRMLRQQGYSDAGIFTLLENRARTQAGMGADLDVWVGARREGVAYDAEYMHRRHVAETLKTAWTRSRVAEESKQPGDARLSIIINDTLPPLTVDFLGIRELTVGGRAMNDGNADSFLARFPNLEQLSIGESGAFYDPKPSLTTVPHAVQTMTSLRSLRIKVNAGSVSAHFSSALNALTGLEELYIDCSGVSLDALKVLELSALTQLKKLKIDAPYALWQWPTSVENLALLERLDLTNTAISTLPDTLYSGHEALWAGLSLDWAKFPYEAFKPAYDYVRAYNGPMGHLVDVHQMVNGFCRGELEYLMGNSQMATSLQEAMNVRLETPEERFAAVEQLSQERRRIFDPFYEPRPVAGRVRLRLSQWKSGENARLIDLLETSWRGAVAQRDGLSANVSTFEWSLSPAEQSFELPQLPAGSFAHVQTLRLNGLRASVEQARGFIKAFSAVQRLELNASDLTKLPIGAGELPRLTRLELANNRLVFSPQLQAQFDDLSHLQYLDLHNNPLSRLEVSALQHLKALNLRSTQLKVWPAGAENLTQLAWLDVRDNQLSALPPDVLSSDELLLKVNLVGNPWIAQNNIDRILAQQRIEVAIGLPEGALERFAVQFVSSDFPPEETAWSIARYLLPLPEVVEGAAGVDGETLARQLNGWIFTRQSPRQGVTVSAESRGLAAQRIHANWRGAPGSVNPQLSLLGLQTGDLPALTVSFAHVRSLDLTGVRLSVQGSNGFLRAFPQLTRLMLSGNALSALPEAVGQMERLERLDFDYNNLYDPEPLYRQLGGEHLRWLDLSHNGLYRFNTRVFPRLQALNLSHNRIEEWPEGALEAGHLRTLNLSGNELMSFPVALLDGTHDDLVGGIDLSDNLLLSLDSLERIRDYSDAHAGVPVMGLSQHDIHVRIDLLERGSETESGAESGTDNGAIVEPAEPLEDPAGEVGASALAPWLAVGDAELKAARTQVWNQLAQTDDHERFFHLIAQLRLTDEFRLSRSDLTQRVWTVMQAASENRELRQLLFQSAETHGTCIDGRILTFSELEVRVYEANALRDVSAGQLEDKGRALLNLSRQLFRLGRVERLAEAAALHSDRAEVRLQYRIGMTRGWPDGLELPGQPEHMAFAQPISGRVVEQARTSVLDAEASDDFLEELITRDYWVRYLQERYRQAFTALDEHADARHEAVEDKHPDRQDNSEGLERYRQALNELEIELGSERAGKLLELSRDAVTALSTRTGVEPQPGPSWRQ